MKGVAGSYYIIVSHDFMHNHLSFQVTLGYNRKKLEKKHWAEMIENPRRPIIHWHVLKVGYHNYLVKVGYDSYPLARFEGW